MRDKIQVLMVGNHPSVKGGITSVIEQLRKYEWDKAGINMEFIATYIDANNVKKIVYFIVAYIKIFVRFIKAKPDVMHIHMSYKGSFQRKFAIHRLCKLFCVKDVIHLHGSEFEKWYGSVGNRTKKKIHKMLKECSKFVVLGERWEEKIYKIEPFTKLCVVSNTVNIPSEVSNWDEKEMCFLFLGVLIKRKGVSDLLDAIGCIKRQGKLENMKFIIAGSGQEENALKEKAKQMSLEERVEFVGWIDGEQKKSLLQRCQVLVLPSYNEGLPIAILEALSYGIPVIATDVGDIASAVKDGCSGYLFSPGDVELLAQKIISMRENVQDYKKMAIEARKISESKFSDKTYFEKIKECYFVSGEME